MQKCSLSGFESHREHSKFVMAPHNWNGLDKGNKNWKHGSNATFMMR